jgi:hypothetical protein
MLCAQFHIDDTRSNDPGPRCGHTLTCVPAEQGGQRLIVFGGATALEGDGPNGGTSGIRACFALHPPPRFPPHPKTTKNNLPLPTPLPSSHPKPRPRHQAKRPIQSSHI